MSTLGIAGLVFSAGYLLNVFYITVFYHRGLTHRAVVLKPSIERWIARTGNWLTGIDPKAWACMHRMHHLHSDSELDPHSPIHQGVFGVLMGQLHSYEHALKKLIKRDPIFTRLVADIPFDVSFLNRKKLWILPYLLHVLIAIGLGLAFHHVLIGLAYFVGIMSHPVQGWMVNSLAHRFGYVNFKRADHSRNNLMVGLLVFGEGYQNNHHEYPKHARFSAKWWELDMGYWMCLVGKQLGMLEIPARRPLHVDSSVSDLSHEGLHQY